MVKNVLPHSALKTLYLTMIQPYLMNGIHVWGNSVHVHKIFNLQKRAIRIVNNKAYRSHTEPLFKSENILMLKDLYTFQILLFMHDLNNSVLPLSFNNFATKNREYIDRTTRQSSLYHTKRPRTNFSSKLPNHAFPRMWNALNEELRNTNDRKMFKRKCSTSFIDSYSISITCNNPHCQECH